MMDGIISVLGVLTLILEGISCQGVYGKWQQLVQMHLYASQHAVCACEQVPFHKPSSMRSSQQPIHRFLEGEMMHYNAFFKKLIN